MKNLIVMCILALLLVQCKSQMCNKTISVNMTSSGRSLTLPMVGQVILWTVEEGGTWNSPDNTSRGREYIVNGTSSSSGWYALTVSSGTVYNVTITFNQTAGSCRNITLDVPVFSRSFTCIPVTSCGDNIEMNTVTWRKAYYMDDDSDNENEYEDLLSGPYRPPASYSIEEMDISGNRISLTNETYEGRVIQNATISFSEVTGLSAGYYIAVNENDEVLYQFTMYYGPIIQGHGSHEMSAIVTAGKENFKDIHCAFSSFPNAVVSWSLRRNGNTTSLSNTQQDIRIYNITEDTLHSNSMRPNQSEVFDYTWTQNGGLEILEIMKNHSGFITCSATNRYNTTQFERRLRVRSPLRPLWPILGIIASFLITAVFIFGGFVVDKIRGDSKNTIDQDEIDGHAGTHTTHNIMEQPLLTEDSPDNKGQYGAFRPLSVNSFNEDDIKESYRRTSSAKELLPLEKQQQQQ